MKTVQLPFFLSSRHATRNTTANRFQVGLSPSVSIPREASDTRVFILEASAVHTMKNVDATNNVLGAVFCLDCDLPYKPELCRVVPSCAKVVPGLYTVHLHTFERKYRVVSVVPWYSII